MTVEKMQGAARDMLNRCAAVALTDTLGQRARDVLRPTFGRVPLPVKADGVPNNVTIGLFRPIAKVA